MSRPVRNPGNVAQPAERLYARLVIPLFLIAQCLVAGGESPFARASFWLCSLLFILLSSQRALPSWLILTGLLGSFLDRSFGALLQIYCLYRMFGRDDRSSWLLGRSFFVCQVAFILFRTREFLMFYYWLPDALYSVRKQVGVSSQLMMPQDLEFFSLLLTLSVILTLLTRSATRKQTIGIIASMLVALLCTFVLGCSYLMLMSPLVAFLPMVVPLAPRAQNLKLEVAQLVPISMGVLGVMCCVVGQPKSVEREVYLRSSMAAYETSTTVKQQQADFSNWILQSQSYGREIRKVDHLDETTLHGVDRVYIINPITLPSTEALSAVRSFVESGGTLIVLTDHTDIGGVMDPTNAYLSLSSIRVRFDSALPSEDDWSWRDRGSILSATFYPQARGLQWLGASVGASRTGSHEVTALSFSNEAFSDWGNPAYGVSRLGDRKLDATERLGGLVLVAGQQVGFGCVLAFGDTALFQNGSSWANRSSVESWIQSSIDRCRNQKVKQWSLIVLVVSTCLLDSLVPMIFLSFFFAVTHYTGDWNRKSARPSQGIAVFGGNSLSNLNRSEERSLSSFVQYANAKQQPVSLLSSLTDLEHAQPLQIVLMPSLIQLTRSQVRQAFELVQKGSTLTILTSPERPWDSELLRQAGIAVSTDHLGAAVKWQYTQQYIGTSRDASLPLRFSNAFPIELDGLVWKPVATAWNWPLVAWRSFGSGKVVVVSDDTFLESKQVQSDGSYTGNAQLLLDLGALK